MKRLLKTALLSVAAMCFLSGCVVYEPRPRVVYYDDYGYYGGPTVVYVHSGYYYHRRWR